MTPSRRTLSPLPRITHLVALFALLVASAVHADDFPEITALLKSGKAVEALAKVDQRLLVAPRDPQLQFLRGVAQTDSGKPVDAIATFTRLTQEYPELPEPYNNLAVLYANQNQLDKARIALEMATQTNPNYATAYENLGDIYAKLAGQAYNKALQLDASNAATIKPKLTIIRNLFSANARAVTTEVATTAMPALAPAPASAPVTTKPSAPPEPTAAPLTAGPVASETVSGALTAAQQDVDAAIRTWAAAWSARDAKTYLAAYGEQFTPPGRQSRAAWEKGVEARIAKKSHIQVTVSDLSVKVSGDHATARFHQAYNADRLRLASRKTLELMRTQGRWMIVRESTGD